MHRSATFARVGHDSPEELFMAGRALISRACHDRNVLPDFDVEHRSDGKCDLSGILISHNKPAGSFIVVNTGLRHCVDFR